MGLCLPHKRELEIRHQTATKSFQLTAYLAASKNLQALCRFSLHIYLELSQIL